MSTIYKKSDDVPTSVLCDRLEELSNAVSQGREAKDREFTMRIPAELDRDADLVLSEAAKRLRIAQPEPDWSESKTAAELWKNPILPMPERLLIADGAVAFRNEVIQNLRATTPKPQAHVPDEREAFEQWMITKKCPPRFLKPLEDGTYEKRGLVAAMWSAWRERASLSATPQHGKDTEQGDE